MRITTLLTKLILLALLLAACSPPATPAPTQPTQPPVDNQATVDAAVEATLAAQPAPPTQPPAPTQPPPAEPTEAPSAEPTAEMVESAGYTPALTGAVWQWSGGQQGGAAVAVNDPSRYQLTFNVDGSVAIQADCNSVLGTYEVGEGNSMTITLGPSTLVACPEDSQADAFLQQLAETATYGFSYSALVLAGTDPSSMMTFQMLPVAILPTPEANDPTATANTGVNLRSGPSTEHTVYGVLPFGATAKVVGKNEDGSWWALNMPVSPTGSGWVSGDYVSIVNADGVPLLAYPAAPQSVEPVAPGPEDPQATALEAVYVRSGPGDTFPAYGVAQPGQTALVIGRSEDNSYWVVRVNPEIIPAGFAWVQASYVQPANTENAPVIQAPAAPSAAPLPPPPTGVPTATATTSVNLRSGPSTEYPVLGIASAGQTGEVVGVSEDGGWWQVRVPTSVSSDGLAWVSGSYAVAYQTEGVPVVTAPPPPEPVETPPPPSGTPSGIWVVTVEPLNVRAGPGNEYPSYGKIPAGVPLQVVGNSSNWLQVSMPALPGGVGWISGNYVVPYSAPIATPY